jgi:NMD protein affecting ribosome stability and mRNA decay
MRKCILCGEESEDKLCENCKNQDDDVLNVKIFDKLLMGDM